MRKAKSQKKYQFQQYQSKVEYHLEKYITTSSSQSKRWLTSAHSSIDDLLLRKLEKYSDLSNEHFKIAHIGIRRNYQWFAKDFFKHYSTNTENVRTFLSTLDWNDEQIRKTTINLLIEQQLPKAFVIFLIDKLIWNREDISDCYKMFQKLLLNLTKGPWWDSIRDSDFWDSQQTNLRSKLIELNNSNLHNPYFYFTQYYWMRFLNYEKDENASSILKNNSIIYYYCVFEKNIYLNDNYQPENYSIYGENCIIAIKIIMHQKLSFTEYEKLDFFLYEELVKISVNNGKSLKTMVDFLDCAYYLDIAKEYLFQLYTITKPYSALAADALLKNKSSLVYREYISQLLTVSNKQRQHSLMKKLVESYPDRILETQKYINKINNYHLIQDFNNTISKLNLSIVATDPKQDVMNQSHSGEYEILDHNILLDDFIISQCQRLKACEFNCAVGFLYASGLTSLIKSFESVSHSSPPRIIIGSLQKYASEEKIRNMDQRTASLLNDLIDKRIITLSTYTSSFYHGKYYYIRGKKEGCVIIGSSNVSRTAFSLNKELDLVFRFLIDSEQDLYFREWFFTFWEQCVPLDSLDINKFSKNIFEVAECVPKRHRRIASKEALRRISSLKDIDQRYRLTLWMDHNPSSIWVDININTKDDYFLFAYKNLNMAVLESFDYGNAYYIFNLQTDIESFLDEIDGMNKSELSTLSCYREKKRHEDTKERLKNSIDQLFK